MAAAEPPCHAYKRRPRTHSSTQATLECSPSSPMAANRPGEAFFPTSGNCGRHHCPGQFGTTRASPSPFSPPRASSSSREPFPLLDFDRAHCGRIFTPPLKPPPPRSSLPAAPSVPTSLAPTGRTALEWRIHPRPRGPAKSCQSPAPIAWAPPPLGAEEEEGEDQSNLTSGSGGPLSVTHASSTLE